MPVYTIETPTGQKLDIEAADEATAISGAQKWHADNNAPVTAGGLAAAAVGGTARGATELAGMPGDLGDLLNRGIDKGLLAVGIQKPTTMTDLIAPSRERPNLLGSKNIKAQVEKLTGDFHVPQNTAEKFVDSAFSFVPGALAAPGGAISNAVRYGILPGLASEAAGQYFEGQGIEPYARAAAGMGVAALNPAARVVTPFPASPARQAAVQRLENEGVTSLTAGQRTGSTGLRYLEDAASHAPLAGQGASRIEHEGQRQFTEAALRRAGTGAEATPEVLAANQARLGQSFQDLSARNNLIPDDHFVNDIVDAARNYRRVPDSQQRQMVQGYLDDIIGHVNEGHMPGPAYQEMRSRLSRQANSLRQTDPTLSEALRDMRNALDNAMGRSISPEDQTLWQNTRREYGAQKVIEKAASRAGEATAEGQITPANLRNTVSAENRGAYARGEGQFAELARAGANVMTPLPNSGTAQRMNAFHLLNMGLMGIPQAVSGRVLMSRPVQDYLSNQLMTGALPNSQTAQQLLIAQMLQRSQQPTTQGQ